MSKATSSDDNAAYEEYIGEGEAHHKPPLSKKMKMAPRPPPVPLEEDPKSVDVFASSQPGSEESIGGGGGGGGSDYETCKETFDEEEEEEKKADEVVMDSQKDNAFDSDSDGSMEIDEPSDHSSVHTARDKEEEEESDADDDRIMDKMTKELIGEKGTTAIITKETTISKTEYVSYSTRFVPRNQVDENLDREEDEEEEDVNRNKKPQKAKEEVMEKEEEEEETNEIEKSIEDFQIDSLHSKTIASASSPSGESTSRKRSSDATVEQMQLDAAEVVEDMDFSDSSTGQGSSKQFQLTEEEAKFLESPQKAPKKLDASILEYRQKMDRLLSEFYEKDLVFQPDYKRVDGKVHYRYCDVQGQTPQDFKRLTQDYTLRYKYPPTRMNQVWQTITPMGHPNERYVFQKFWLNQYLKDHRHGSTSFQMFSGLIHTQMDLREYVHFSALWAYFKHVERETSQKEALEQFANVVRLALSAEELLPKCIYTLTGAVQSATFNHRQCAAIVARMFFTKGYSTKSGASSRENNELPNFLRIMSSADPIAIEKLKFIFNYTQRMSLDPPEGIVSFRRIMHPPDTTNKMWTERRMCALPEVNISETMFIEETACCTQIDFANARLGGGVLTSGSVQEEIRFLMCPEMMVSQWLFPRSMADNEAFSIVGAMAFSSYSGYANTLKWMPLEEKNAHQNQSVIRDEYNRLRVETLAIDATEYPTGSQRFVLSEQLSLTAIRREAHKAFNGFTGQKARFDNIPIVTGWWGCGAFRGNKAVKCEFFDFGILERNTVI
uniref:poly(ADP-ribose) glycohydrolase n=1 Tax=Caenorhabditis tropicalis TaxID=1561998 RepID=A0A1I7TPC4_9PELO